MHIMHACTVAILSLASSVLMCVLHQTSGHCTLTSCVSENSSLTKLSKASIDFSTRFPPMDHT